MAIPKFVIDLPGGKGKVPLVPDYIIEATPGRIHFRAPLGGEATYTDPAQENAS